jgi:hypothetical protein
MDDQAFRYDYRKMTDGERFHGVMSQIVAKRPT